MSWYVERLLIESDSIKNSQELDSDLFLDLLTLESKINSLYNAGFISVLEMSVLGYMMMGYSVSAASKKLRLARSTTSLIFKNICTRIAFHLGEQFTDDGYLDDLAEKYGLTQKEVFKAEKFMSGRYRHTFTRSR